ncbi:hypothetical protein NB311A_20141 [Nitrobacter sp. Nb-311A]|uniref:hypothetical protein n=1 Tax=Nitrobacter sp. Nb-311A TaxID=314253 RepID=UPI0000687A53|nr:hypothetical protein [Nitrobacter sp. Nb-311A]EAQ36284.1 hypothetical protein NB311A_20141 [Nitrobacter sp. Nb-311A]
MTQEEVRDEAALVNGERLFSTAKISRFEKDPEGTPTPPGLEKTAIARLYYTSSRIGVACQELELSLRIADFEKRPLEHLIRAAEEFLRDARKWIINLYETKAVDAATLAEWNLDCASLDSLAQQMRLYRARFAEEAQKARLYSESLKFGREVQRRLHDAIVACPNAEAADVILAGRSLLNAFFATFMLDGLNGNQLTLPLSHDFARNSANPHILLTGFKAASWTNDPRIALYLGELTSLVDTGGKPRGALDVRIARPSHNMMLTAARLVFLAKKIDRNELTPVRNWRPKWLTGELLSQLEPALELVESDEKTRNLAN